MKSEDEWGRFCERAAAAMRDAHQNRITLNEASAFFERDQTISNPDLRRYVESMVWEIDGSPGYFMELLRLFESQTSEEQMVRQLLQTN